MDLVCSRAGTQIYQGEGAEMSTAAEQGGQGFKAASHPAGIRGEIPPPSHKLGTQTGSPYPFPGGVLLGADVSAALQHMYPSVSPSVGVYGALTQETCDGRTVARLREGSNHTGVLSAD